MKVDIFLSISDFCFLGRRQIYLRAVFWNNGQVLGSCLYSIVLARELFLELVIITSARLRSTYTFVLTFSLNHTQPIFSLNSTFSLGPLFRSAIFSLGPLFPEPLYHSAHFFTKPLFKSAHFFTGPLFHSVYFFTEPFFHSATFSLSPLFHSTPHFRSAWFFAQPHFHSAPHFHST